MARPILKPGMRIYIQVTHAGIVEGSPTVVTAKYPPRGQGYWVDITECVNTCCGDSEEDEEE